MCIFCVQVLSDSQLLSSLTLSSTLIPLAMECFVAFGFMAVVAFMAPKKKVQEPTHSGKRSRGSDETLAALPELDKTNMLNQLKAARRRLLAKTSQNEEEDQAKSDLLDSYCKLSLRDPKKNDILKRWLGDKSCQWWANYAEETVVGVTTTSETFRGWGTKSLSSIKSRCLSCSVDFILHLIFFRYVVADILKMPHTAPELDAVCDEIPHDDQWSIEDPIERGYAKAGLKRYSLTHVRLMVEKISNEEANKQTLSMTKEAKAANKSSISLVLNPGVGSGSLPAIKEEVVGWNGFKNVLTMLKSGKGM